MHRARHNARLNACCAPCRHNPRVEPTQAAPALCYSLPAGAAQSRAQLALAAPQSEALPRQQQGHRGHCRLVKAVAGALCPVTLDRHVHKVAVLRPRLDRHVHEVAVLHARQLPHRPGVRRRVQRPLQRAALPDLVHRDGRPGGAGGGREHWQPRAGGRCGGGRESVGVVAGCRCGDGRPSWMPQTGVARARGARVFSRASGCVWCVSAGTDLT